MKIKKSNNAAIIAAARRAAELESKLGGIDGWYRHCAYEYACHMNCGMKYTTSSALEKKNNINDDIKAAVNELAEIYLNFSIRADKQSAQTFYENK